MKVKELGYVHPSYLANLLGYWAMEHQIGTMQDVQDIGDDDNYNDNNNPNATMPSNSYQIPYNT